MLFHWVQASYPLRVESQEQVDSRARLGMRQRDHLVQVSTQRVRKRILDLTEHSGENPREFPSAVVTADSKHIHVPSRLPECTTNDHPCQNSRTPPCRPSYYRIFGPSSETIHPGLSKSTKPSNSRKRHAESGSETFSINVLRLTGTSTSHQPYPDAAHRSYS